MPAMMNSNVKTNPGVIPDALRRGTPLRRSGIHGTTSLRRACARDEISIRPLFPAPFGKLRMKSRDPGISQAYWPSGPRLASGNAEEKTARRVKHGVKQSRYGAPHFGVFGLKPGKSQDAKGANGAPLLTAGGGSVHQAIVLRQLQFPFPLIPGKAAKGSRLVQARRAKSPSLRDWRRAGRSTGPACL